MRVVESWMVTYHGVTYRYYSDGWRSFYVLVKG